ncbi:MULTISPECIES: DUF3019 domain-containing protein [Shewanella]|uniref:DUF3019 domain-containing protein n=1 Tax=Shewanella marisflavi TaxID=260364 RepID=A0ABX5WQ34_9GAMM|nr:MULTISPECIES: DUF3019 domain-containing protein [Shewanella]MCL1040407.1 DUF3019 domain-containing protein [Shewanella marisflavi]QDF76354.1 DUF3019 domain-containing protein [Shewanella marisflavi]
MTFKLIQAILVILLLCNITYAMGQESAASLSLSPQFCITADVEQSCEIELVLSWETPYPQVVCIMSDHNALEKWCADSPNTHSLTVKVKTQHDIQFVMIDKQSHQTLAGVKLKVTPTSTPQVRRRYRNPWSLF